MKSNKGVYKAWGEGFSKVSLCSQGLSQTTEGIFQLIGIPGPLLMDFNNTQTAT